MSDSQTLPTAEREALVCNQRGLHARASARFCEAASGFDAEVTVAKDGQAVDGASLMDLLMLGAAQGSRLTIKAVGADAKEAVAVLVALTEGGFGEGC